MCGATFGNGHSVKACSQYFYFRLQDASFIFDLLSTPGLASRDFLICLVLPMPLVNEFSFNFCRIIMLNFLSVFLSTVLSTYRPLTGQIMYHGIRIGRGSVVPTLPWPSLSARLFRRIVTFKGVVVVQYDYAFHIAVLLHVRHC